MRTKRFYALTYCFEGVDDNCPYACTIAVSENKENLIQLMKECVEEDCTKPTDEDDEWNTDCNYQVFKNNGDEVMLQHRKYINLYTTYKIHFTDVV
jgi:hypothetical protein